MTTPDQLTAPDGFRITGQAVVTVLAGRYRVTHGEASYLTDTGDGGQDAAAAVARGHGLLVGPWSSVTLPGCGGETVHTAPLYAPADHGEWVRTPWGQSVYVSKAGPS
jgi:hypothetical protein